MRKVVSFTLFPDHGLLVLLLGLVVQPQYEGFLSCLIVTYCFVLFGCCDLKTYFFLKGNREGVHLWERTNEMILGGVERGNL